MVKPKNIKPDQKEPRVFKTLHVPPSLWQALKERAETEGRSLNNYIVHTLSQATKEGDQK